MNHHYIDNQSKQTFILFHGTGGSMQDLIPIAKFIDEKANILTLEGHILEGAYKRYFKRHAMGKLDQASLEKEAIYVMEQIETYAIQYHFDISKATFLGYSNGANLIAGMFFIKPEFIKKAILFNAMLPFINREPVSKIDANILLTAGKFDQMIPFYLAEKLMSILVKHGAHVEFSLTSQQHQISESNVETAKIFYNTLKIRQ